MTYHSMLFLYVENLCMIKYKIIWLITIVIIIVLCYIHLMIGDSYYFGGKHSNTSWQLKYLVIQGILYLSKVNYKNIRSCDRVVVRLQLSIQLVPITIRMRFAPGLCIKKQLVVVSWFSKNKINHCNITNILYISKCHEFSSINRNIWLTGLTQTYFCTCVPNQELDIHRQMSQTLLCWWFEIKGAWKFLFIILMELLIITV